MESELMTTISVFYYPYQNLFKDSNGRVIVNIYRLVPPYIIYLFKHHKTITEYINRKYNIKIRILYPLTIEEE